MKVYLGILDTLQSGNKGPNDLLRLGVADAEPAHAPPPFGAMAGLAVAGWSLRRLEDGSGLCKPRYI